jgi:NAD(P)-dependent dehydrogenase (short-subunit alcohol dehydrogenase family)
MKTVIITGANGHLGRVVTDRFGQNGYQVIALVSPGKKAQAPAISFEADLTDEELTNAAVQQILKNYPTVDACLLLAGGWAGGKLAATDRRLLDQMIDTNFRTAYHVARPVFEHMLMQPQGGRIVLVGARPALVAKDGKNNVAYALSKSLVFQLANLMNAEGAANNVITSVVVPSTIDTEANRLAMPGADFNKWVSPADIADTMLYLCSQQASPLRDPVIKMYGNS